ncbi:uncharacterized protein K452DRAFT_291640 [Aplosporella prunicola CBS 121167]|uniref:Uncharacterized protein n=1 Tax=Aplosporella prunicola CBS 121167 TaxID=1176127 RepID=A0A6A6AZP3_9PEZI|nr:uncharacterized protein K452DRAFT_291640 [Aplosporella prunicola CBS 121167]KAF2137389.1 hypothetical protein K452DRAFT_291640 [Aplosporella prunicola CBS 121167]
MKFSFAAITAFAAAAMAKNFDKFTVATDGGAQLVTDGQYFYKATGPNEKRPLAILSGGDGKVTFTAEGAAPTGWQNLYVIEKAVQPLSMTVPHSGATPINANISAFSVKTVDGVDYLDADGGSFALPTGGNGTAPIYFVALPHTGPAYEVVKLYINELN